MSIIDKLGKAVIPLAVVGSMFLGGCKTYEPPVPNPKTEVIDAFPSKNIPYMKKQLSNKKLALALITSSDYDHNDATVGMENMFKKDFSDLPNYVLYTKRTANLDEFFNDLRDYSVVDSIDALILAYHGYSGGMSVGSGYIGCSNVDKLFKNYSSLFSKDAVILLYSCSTGEGDENIAIDLANVLHRDVIAPKFTLIPETDLFGKDRVGEFAPDKNGRLAFDYKNFRTYPELKFKGDKYMNSLAPFSYHKMNGDQIDGKNGKSYFLIINK